MLFNILLGIETESLYVFKSAKNPLLLTFKTSTRSKFKVIYKCGDDLRQDQLIIQVEV